MPAFPLRGACLLGLLAAAGAWSWSPERRPRVRDPLTEALRQASPAARSAKPEPGKARRPVAATLPDAGQIAVLDDSEGAFLPPASFDLDNRTLRFEPATADAAQYTYVLTASGFDPTALGSGTALRLGDDDAAQVTLPFVFPYFGQRYASIFVHSDGDLTVSAPEASSTARDLSRFLTGPPRLAPLFADLDPTQSGAVVSYVVSSERVVVTWSNVPLYADTPAPSVPRQTFQAALYPSGRIEFSYRGINTAEGAVVGIAPGGSTSLTQVDFSVASTTRYSAAVAEDFSALPTFDFALIAKKFYTNHEDAYDFLVIFDAATRGDLGCAFTIPVRNDVHGLGLRVTLLGIEEFNAAGAYGSAGRLQNVVYFGPLSRYPSDPTLVTDLADGCGRNSVMSILGQEAGHRFLAYPAFRDPSTGTISGALLGRDFAHWSFFLHTDASVMEGNQIQDRGEGATPRFITRAINQRYSALDQYMMGLRTPEEVASTFLVRQPTGTSLTAASSPETGISFDGVRQEITLPMIVAAEGPRAPDSRFAPKTFRFAFALLTRAGQAASPADIAKLEGIRTAWERFFNEATSGRGQAETTLRRQLAFSISPSAAVLAGASLTGAVNLGAPATAPVTVNLTASSGSAAVPASVTIPAGSRSASFTVTGNSAGLAEITGRAGDSYETARTTVQVRSGAAGLVLERLESSPLLGDFLVVPAFGLSLQGGPGIPLEEKLRFRVRDSNFLPYPGLRLSAAASGGGSVSPATLVTGANGIVEVEWRLAPQPGLNTLSVSLEAQPDIAVQVQATGVYQPYRRRGQ